MAESIAEVSLSQEGGKGWIYDRADLLDWQTEWHLSRRINKLVGRTSAELAIVTLTHIDSGQSPRAVAVKLFNAWGIGKRDTNNGVLLLISQHDRRIEIITGKGLQAVLPDAEVSRLIQQEIVPAFRQQQYATGTIRGVEAIAQRLEERLSSTIFPSWMPESIVWIPWIIAIGGAGLTIFATVRLLVLSFTPVRVPVPTQGFNNEAFSASEILAVYPFSSLLAKVVTRNSDPEVVKVANSMIPILAGGWIGGIGLIYGFWQFVLRHPEAEFWQSDRISWIVLGVASSAWWLWGLLVASRFVTRDWPWLSFPLSLSIVVLLAGLGGLFGHTLTTAWCGSVLMIAILSGMIGGFAWAMLINPYLYWQRQRDYRSDRTGEPPQELTPEELESVLTAPEMLARSMGKLEFRGWREADLTLPLTRDRVYLVQRLDRSANICAHCQSYAVEVSEQTVERTIETTQKLDRKRQKKITSVRLVPQTVYTCHFCGSVFAYDRWSTPTITSSDRGDDSSSDSNSSYSSSSSDISSYDQSYNNDYGSSASDFGGGSSDGGGAGSDW
jgi:uncharacterized protein